MDRKIAPAAFPGVASAIDTMLFALLYYSIVKRGKSMVKYDGGPSEMTYEAKLKSMGDVELAAELNMEGCDVRAVEHEISRRFCMRAGQRLGKEEYNYYISKLVEMGNDFQTAYYQKNWTTAKQLYDTACTVCGFLEVEPEIWEQLFGRYNSQTDSRDQGLFHDKMRDVVMRECIIRDNLGFECMVYRIPGEAGYYNAAPGPGRRYMAADENPAYLAG